SAHVVWICIPPCADLPLIIETSISVGLHVIVEKPWLVARGRTEFLLDLARVNHVLVAIHFQYCFLDAVEALKRHSELESRILFGGTFTVSRPDRLGIPAVHNLGSHLMAIREYAVPSSEVVGMQCGYALQDERYVSIESASGLTKIISLET